MVRVVHLSQTDSGAGAGRAAYRIHRGLCALGVDSSMIVAAAGADTDTEPARQGRFGRNVVRAASFLEAKLGRRLRSPHAGYLSPAAFSGFDPGRDARVLSADVVALYWINGGFVRPEGLAGIAAPIVWRLSDIWPFTGGCHYPGTCTRFKGQCGQCPQLANPGERDWSRRLWSRKQKAWRDLNLTIAAPSRWIAGLAERSSLFTGRRTVVIPTGVDLQRFRPIAREAARASLGLPLDRDIIAFGSLDPAGDTRKGFRELAAAMDELAGNGSHRKPLAVAFGGPKTPDRADTVLLGRIDDDERLAHVYAAADAVIVPSIEDNLPNVALEAVACGTPVVGFNVCGMPDVVRHEWNGFLAAAVDGRELAAGIRWVLSDPVRLQHMRRNARALAEERFDLDLQVRRYRDLYHDLYGGGGLRGEGGR